MHKKKKTCNGYFRMLKIFSGENEISMTDHKTSIFCFNMKILSYLLFKKKGGGGPTFVKQDPDIGNV